MLSYNNAEKIHTRWNLFFLIVLLPEKGISQGVKVTYSHNLSINPFKKILGLINLEYEYFLAHDLSVKVSVEYMIGDKLFVANAEHPKLFADAGMRYYLREKKIQPEGFFIGVLAGHTFDHKKKDNSSFVLGLENGYLYNIEERFYLTPKLSGYYQFKQQSILPGFGIRAGYSY